jgi:hypothetical protein
MGLFKAFKGLNASGIFQKAGDFVGKVATVSDKVNGAIQSFAPVIKTDLQVHSTLIDEANRPWYQKRITKIIGFILLIIAISIIIIKKLKRKRY